MKRLLGALLLFSVVGCATQHPKIAQQPTVDCGMEHSNSPCLTPRHLECHADNSCDWVQSWYPSQLTPAGCLVHTVVTFGHIAQECRKKASHGRWIWGGGK